VGLPVPGNRGGLILFLRGWLWLVGCAVAWDKQPYH
ncbi:MAG: hypothetical protein ACI92G_003526, partial [Candidatus Pelagisphaera sp.]